MIIPPWFVKKTIGGYLTVSKKVSYLCLWDSCAIIVSLAGGYGFSNTIHQVLLIRFGQLMDVNNVFEETNSHIAGTTADAMIAENAFEFRKLTDNVLNAGI